VVNPSNSYVEKGRLWYDTKKGVEVAIRTLNGFCNLIYERYQAGYVREESLNQLYIFGDYSFDTVGNCSVSQPSIKKIYPNIPNVLTHAEFWEFIKKNSGGKDLFGISFVYDQSIPSELVHCPVCKKGWSIENVYDVITRRVNSDFKLAGFIGKSLGKVKQYYASRADAKYFIGTEPFLHNNRFKDNTPWTLTPKNDFEKTMVKNDNGWVGTKDGITDDYIIQQDDVVTFSIIHYFHSGCNREYLETKELNSFQEIFTKAGFSKIELKSIPNEYCSCNMCAPWFEANTELGVFKIGWRKRVINIDWTRVNNKKKLLKHLFIGEDVTKGNNYIHAWGDEKAIDYLSRIVNYCKG